MATIRVSEHLSGCLTTEHAINSVSQRVRQAISQQPFPPNRFVAFLQQAN